MTIPAVLALLDRVAELTQAGDERHAQVWRSTIRSRGSAFRERS
jgi:hypothetical protein